jgi:hypothetical protein
VADRPAGQAARLRPGILRRAFRVAAPVAGMYPCPRSAGWGCQGWDLLAADEHRCGPAQCQLARMRLSMEFAAASALESQDADIPDQGGCGPAGGQR